MHQHTAPTSKHMISICNPGVKYKLLPICAGMAFDFIKIKNTIQENKDPKQNHHQYLELQQITPQHNHYFVWTASQATLKPKTYITSMKAPGV